MGRHYTHLQAEERMTLASLRQQSWSIRAIAQLLGHSPSTVSRELGRNNTDGGYASAAAQGCTNPGKQLPWRSLETSSSMLAARVAQIRSQ